jgi:hypothetical protein
MRSKASKKVRVSAMTDSQRFGINERRLVRVFGLCMLVASLGDVFKDIWPGTLSPTISSGAIILGGVGLVVTVIPVFRLLARRAQATKDAAKD